MIERQIREIRTEDKENKRDTVYIVKEWANYYGK